MLKDVDLNPGKTCDTTALTRVLTLAKKLKISATPTLLFEDESIEAGFLPLDQLDNQPNASTPAKR